MPAATQPVITKKQTPIAKRERALPLHRELTQTQEEVVDLVSQILFQGGRREEVMPFLKALYRHQFRNRGFYGANFNTEAKWEADTIQMGESQAENAFRELVRHWPSDKTQAWRPTDLKVGKLR